MPRGAGPREGWEEEPTESTGAPPDPASADSLESAATGSADGSLLRDLAHAPAVPLPEGGGVPLAPGDVLLDRYELIRRLGRGGMATVFLGRDLRLGRRVAIKALDLPLGDDERRARWRELFEGEARATARLNHPNIVTLYEAGRSHGRPFLVLELLQGRTLAQRVREGRIPVGTAVDIAQRVAAALAHAHERGILHRDLKPQNVWLADDGSVKVMDFGLAQVERVDDGVPRALFLDTADGPRPNSPAPALGGLSGTPAYMAPEQWRGEPQDGRTDVWALGLTLLEMVLGEPVLPPRAPLECRERVLADGPMPAAGALVPDLPPPLAVVVDRVLAKAIRERPGAAEFRDVLNGLQARVRAPSAGPITNPYRFLDAFTEHDTAVFYGRDREVARLHQMVQSHERVAVVGPSGAGKSSLVRAGLLPRLREDAARWRVLQVRPGSDPLAAHQRMVEAVTPVGVPADVRDAPGEGGRTVRAYAAARRERVAIVIDPLEEAFTTGVSREDLQAWAAALQALADDASGPIRLILVVREDFLSRLAELGELADPGRTAFLLLSPPGSEALREAVSGPAATVGYGLEDGLVDELLGPIQGHAAPLPMLQFAASRLFEERDAARHLLTREALARLGGVAGILAAHADDVVRALGTERERTAARRLLTSLVTPEGTRRSRPSADIVGPEVDDVASRVLHQCVRGRLLTQAPGGEVELSHESLIQGWPRLADWLREDRDDLRRRERLEEAARHWRERGRPRELLWAGAVLDDAVQWLARSKDPLGPLAAAFLVVSRSRARHARTARRVAVAAVVGAALLVAALATSAMQVYRDQERDARAREQQAIDAGRAARAQALALASEREGDRDNVASLRLAVEAAQTRDSTAGPDALRLALTRPWVEAVLAGHRDLVAHLAVSPDGERWATGGWDGTARTFEATGRQIGVLRHGAPVPMVAVSPLGDRVLTASWDGSAGLWNWAGELQARLLGHRGKVRGVRYAPDGLRMITWGEDGAPRVWDREGRPGSVLRGPPELVWNASFSPDGQHVAAAFDNGDVAIWSAAGPLRRLWRAHPDAAETVCYSPDGALLVTTGWGDLWPRLWRVSDGHLVATLKGHTGRVSRALFHPAGRLVVTLSYDRTARLWTSQGEPRSVLTGHDGRVVDAAFGPDGEWLATVDDAGVGLLWDLNGQPLGALRGHVGWLTSVVVDPGGHRIGTSGQDGTARLWQFDASLRARLQDTLIKVREGRLAPDGPTDVLRPADAEARSMGLPDQPTLAFLPAPLRSVTELVLSPSGGLAVTASGDRVARLWDLSDSRAPTELRGHGSWVHHARWAPDGRSLATVSEDGTVRVWDTTGQVRRVLTGGGSALEVVAFHPQDGRVAAAGREGVVHVWGPDGTPAGVWPGHKGPVVALEWSPDGTALVTASTDGTARMWSADGRLLRVLGAGLRPLVGARFSPSGDTVLTRDSDEARLWTRAGDPLATLAVPGAHVVMAAFSADGQTVVVGTNTGAIGLWDAAGRPGATLLGHRERVSVLRFSPDGSRLLSASGDGTGRLWTRTGQRLATLSGPGGFVLDAGFSPDGRRVLLAGWDGRVWVYDADGTLRATLVGADRPVTAAAFAPDGRSVWAWCRDTTVLRHPLDTGDLLAEARRRLRNVPQGRLGLNIGFGWNEEGATGATAKPPGP